MVAQCQRNSNTIERPPCFNDNTVGVVVTRSANIGCCAAVAVGVESRGVAQSLILDLKMNTSPLTVYHVKKEVVA